VLKHEAEVLRNSLPDGMTFEKIHIKAAWFVIKEPDALVEAWNGLERFPPRIAQGLASARSHLYDLATAKEICGDATWDFAKYDSMPPLIKQVRTTANKLAGSA